MRRQVTKRMILIVTCLVFALALSGTVAADDSQGGGLEDNSTMQSTSEQSNVNDNGSGEVDPRIYGVIKENTTPANGATITIKNPTTNSTIATGATNSSGAYDIYFTSSLTEFKVEISYLTYKIFSTTVTPTGTPIATANLNHTFMPSQMLKPVKMVILSTRLQAVGPLNQAYLQELVPAGYDFELRIYDSAQVGSDPEYLEKFGNELKDANILYMFHVGSLLTSNLAPYARLMPADGQIFQTSCSGSFAEYGRTVVNLGYSTAFGSDLSQENLKRVILEILRRTGSIQIDQSQTVLIPTIKDFVCHPDTSDIFTTRESYQQWYVNSGKYKSDAPWVGIVIHSWYYTGNDLAVYNALIRELESRGANVMLLVAGSNTNRTITEPFFMVNGTPLIDVLIIHLHTSMGLNVTDAIDFYEKFNVVVISPVHTNLLLEDYFKDSNESTYSKISTSWYLTGEMQGRTQPIFIGGSSIASIDDTTGAIVKIFAPYMPGIEQLADRAVSWATLRMKANNAKKIALVYFDNTHDEGMPVGGGLNIEASLTNILKALANEGYNLGSLDIASFTSDTLLALIMDHGRNLVKYTPEDLETLIQKGAPTISVERYLQLYNALPEKLRQEVEAMWGPAPGNLMVYNGRIVFPGMIIGNIFVGPQPIWKWNGTTANLDDNNLPPTHQYIAFYLWLQKDFRADAVVHTGEHGTLELLPGRPLGMTEEDWPNTLIGNLPHIYIYSGANDNAKRRAYAVIITHLIPPLTEAKLYGNMEEMHDLIASFEDALNKNDTERQVLIKNQILEKVKNEDGLLERLGIDSTASFSVVINKLHNYLHELQTLLTPFGLHTFGELPDNETLEKFIDALIAYDPANRTSRRDEIRNLLIQSANDEMASLLDALNGGFIKPVVGRSPVRVLDSLPTGRNAYSFDPQKVPDAAAMTIGSAAAEAMLQRYLEENDGKYPETIGTTINGGEIMTTNGESIAAVFYFLGVKPIYNSGTIIGTEVIPLDQLNGRPRIDVLISASVSFRDICANLVGIIDNAVKQVALLDESLDKNYVRKHYLAMMGELEAELQSQGLSEADAQTQAERLARARIFGLPPGADPHAAGVARLLRSSDAWTDDELAETYLDYHSFLYGNGIDGLAGRSVMEKLMRSVDTTMQITPRLTAGLRYTGMASMGFVVKHLTGREITSYFVRTGLATIDGGNANGIKVQTLREALYDDLTMTLFNPLWREGMMKEGYSGQARIALRLRSMFSTNALTGAIDGATWQRLADMYLFDQSFYSQLDPAAAQMIADVVYQANQRGMMQLSSGQADQLAQMMGKPVNGQTNNVQPGANQGAVPQLSVSYQSSQSSSAGASSDASSDVSEAGDQSDQSAGDSAKVYEVSQATPQGADDSPWGAYAVVGIVSVLALAGIGFFFKGSLLGR